MTPPHATPDWSLFDRRALEPLRERWLCRGGPWKADLSVVSSGGCRAVLKDFSTKSRLTRLLGRFQVAREVCVYRALAGLEGVPPLLARPSPDSLLVGYVDGGRLSKQRGSEDAPRLARQLQSLIEEFHRRGVAHVDLRGRNNILVDASRRLWVLDFGASWLRGSGGGLRHLLFAIGRRVDRAGILKWRLLLDPHSVGQRAQRRNALFMKLRRLWFFNPKGRARPHGSSR